MPATYQLPGQRRTPSDDALGNAQAPGTRAAGTARPERADVGWVELTGEHFASRPITTARLASGVALNAG